MKGVYRGIGPMSLCFRRENKNHKSGYQSSQSSGHRDEQKMWVD